MISDAMRSQGDVYFFTSFCQLLHSGSSAYTCWAFSCASMLRTSCKLLIQRCHELGLISKIKMDRCTEYISEEEVHVEIRNLIMMILLPKKLHVDDSSQAAFLRAAVSRVNWYQYSALTVNLDCQSNCHGGQGARFFVPNLEVDATSR